jgi:hypothetical protein
MVFSSLGSAAQQGHAGLLARNDHERLGATLGPRLPHHIDAAYAS